MSTEDCFPHFDFDFHKIHEYWKLNLANYTAARKYLRVVQRRLEYWIQERGPWIDFDFAAEHLKKDLHVSDAESQLMWVALQRRVRIANAQRRELLPSQPHAETEDIGMGVRLSRDGQHDAIWHADFRKMYMRAMARELKELRKLRDVGMIPTTAEESRQKSQRPERVNGFERPRLQWMWASRLLAYLFETLREREAIYDNGEMWAALDGLFRDRHGEPITRKDLALWAHQYHSNKSSGDEVGKPKKHELIDHVIERFQG
jgi:hypothetical protein